ncbi:MAG TPA: ABC transporter substrate-binding protein [Candidimonas sp.]|nr:ABC transporter substrate-binding protein [Candidimonas sp.]
MGGTAYAEEAPIRIGFISDLTGISRDADGPAGADAIRMAIEDQGIVMGRKVELLVADHQNRADIASATAREWFDQRNLDMLIAGANSSAALAMSKVASEKQKPFFVVSAGTSELTNAQCSPYTVHYAYDTVSLAQGTAKALVDDGQKSWYFLTVDHAFGHALQKDASSVVSKNGGKVAGSVKHPLNTADFSSYILQAQASGAQVLGLATSAHDLINAIKTAKEFGVVPAMKIAALLALITDIHAIGLPDAQGLYLTSPWYWDLNDESRAWAQRFQARNTVKPTMLQAADYSAAFNYLEAVKGAKSTNGDDVMKWLRSNKINDFFIKDGQLRPDGLMLHDMYLIQVKTPAQSKGPWDYYNVVKRMPGNEVYAKLSDTACPLVKG